MATMREINLDHETSLELQRFLLGEGKTRTAIQQLEHAISAAEDRQAALLGELETARLNLFGAIGKLNGCEVPLEGWEVLRRSDGTFLLRWPEAAPTPKPARARRSAKTKKKRTRKKA